MDRQSALEVRIRKELKDFTLNMEFSAGKGCLGILGASGCGKSMTLKSIAGVVTPDEGRIVMEGETGSHVLYDSALGINQKPQARNVGYLFQNYALFPNMTVEENIAAGLKSRKKGRRPGAGGEIRRRTGEMVERFGLSGLEKRFPSQLSGGQQQRTALARIMAYEPETVLLDEPFSAMDAHLREKLRLELLDMLKDYRGVSVLVTHDRDEAFQLCSSMVFVDRGQILAAGETRELFQNPGTCRAARMTGCKNISRIQRTGRCRVRAMDWGGLELTVDRPVGDEITAVGIRAHDFEPLSRGEAAEWAGREEANLIPVNRPRVSEMPCEWYVTLDSGLWWKVEKSIHTHAMGDALPEYLRVPPEAVMLLTGDLKP